MKKPAILIAAQDEALRNRLKAALLLDGCEVIDVSDNPGTRSFHSMGLNLLVLGLTRDGPSPLSLSCETLAASLNRCLSDILPGTPPVAYETPTCGSINGQPLIGESPSMQEIKTNIDRVATTDSNVLITGETGTGNELVADLIHRKSLCYQGPLVSINCVAIPDGLLESELFGYERGAFTGAHALKEGQLRLADGGTAFFDEIGDMNPYAQAKILRAIEGKTIYRLGGKRRIPLNIRVIAATNQDLEQLVSQEKFRKDLYFRLNVARIHLPPLRERKEDIGLLCQYYLGELNDRCGRQVEGFTDDVLDWMIRYDWPGNVRELKNLLEATFVNAPCGKVALTDLPEQFRQRVRETASLPQDERERLLSALFSTNWNFSKAAQQLHWSRMTLYRKLGKYQIAKGGKPGQDATRVPPEEALSHLPRRCDSEATER
jgi:transcriptional regulator with PAS, ATPase and Fis domain